MPQPVLTLRGHAANLAVHPRHALAGERPGHPCGEQTLRAALRDLSTDQASVERLRAFTIRHDLLRSDRVAFRFVADAIVVACRGRFAAFVVPDPAFAKSGEASAADDGIEGERNAIPIRTALYGGVRLVGGWGDPPKTFTAPPASAPKSASSSGGGGGGSRAGGGGAPGGAASGATDASKAPPTGKEQAQTRQNAHRDGAPFCEICAKMAAGA